MPSDPTVPTSGVPGGYDVIGDVHGHADKLIRLLQLMGYSVDHDAWRHPHRQAVFVGDLIDNGPQQVATVDIVRRMAAAGSARVVMGNHEFNAIAWHRGWREHSTKNRNQHKAFLAEIGDSPVVHDDIVDWFAGLPLWLDLGGLRVVHACWDDRSMDALAPHLSAGNSLSENGLMKAASKDSVEFKAVEILLKGPEVALPEGLGYRDKQGHPRTRARYQWWSDGPATYEARAYLPAGSLTLDEQPHPGFPDDDLPLPLPVDSYVGPPVIYGHYWHSGALHVTSTKTACVDYTAGRGGPLVAYRWDGEPTLTAAHMVASP